jgi:(+)-trans-carveol dehydrogenase
MDEKVALISGAGRGQGRSHAVRLAAEGADVIAVDICADIGTVPYALASEADLDETVAQVESHGRRAIKAIADVRSLPEMEQAVAAGLSAFGKVDIVLGNAGVESYAKTWEMSADQWREMIDVNLTGVFNTVRAALPSMVERGEGGSIVLTSSAAALRAYEHQAHYTTAKLGVIGFAKVLARELGVHGIRVNVVCPMTVRTKMILNDATFQLFAPHLENPTEDDAREFFAALPSVVPDLPWIEPGDVSDAILFLCSDAARFINGATLPVDAGTTI